MNRGTERDGAPSETLNNIVVTSLVFCRRASALLFESMRHASPPR